MMLWRNFGIEKRWPGCHFENSIYCGMGHHELQPQASKAAVAMRRLPVEH